MRTDSRHGALSRTLRLLAIALDYPGDELRAHLPLMRAALDEQAALGPARREAVDALLQRLADEPPMQSEAAYVDLFDRGRDTSLHLFEHVHGDSRERGPAMIDLIQTYEAAGLHLEPHELPDHLGVILEFASTQPDEQARSFLGEIVHLLDKLHTALRRRESDYAAIPAALIELAGEEPCESLVVPSASPEANLDESWQEPIVFGGCSTEGQQRSAPAVQPVHLVRRNHAPAPAQGARP